MLNDQDLTRLLSKIDKRGEDECWPWLGRLGGRPTHKYGQFSVSHPVRGTVYAHRLMYQQFVGPIPDELCVRHKCDHTWCVNPKHLEVGTHQDNMQDRVLRNRGYRPRGVLNVRNNLTEEQVLDIWHRTKAGERSAVVAEAHGVTLSTVQSIRGGASWGWLTGGRFRRITLRDRVEALTKENDELKAVVVALYAALAWRASR